ncbi:MAG: XRE family transcriptional regulator [Cytophagia bacterium]|nr:XRE family transcriptional regulator [Cytophagia bacterium]
MITREELLKSPEYWFENAQNELYRQVIQYKESKGINQSELATELGVTKGYVSQILKGEFNYTLKKLIEISLAIGKVPQIEYREISELLTEDRKTQHLPIETESTFTIDGGQHSALKPSVKEASLNEDKLTYSSYNKAS